MFIRAATKQKLIQFYAWKKLSGQKLVLVHNCIFTHPFIQTCTIALTYFAKYVIEGEVLAVRKYLNITSA